MYKIFSPYTFSPTTENKKYHRHHNKYLSYERQYNAFLNDTNILFLHINGLDESVCGRN